MFAKKKKIKELTDEQLVVEMRFENAEAFNEIYKRYADRILYYFYRMLGKDKELAQDFLQDLFYKVIDKSLTFDANKKFSTWIFCIAHNMCKNEYRSREVRKVLIHEGNLDKYDWSEQKEERYPITVNDIYSELESLDESHRTAFILKYREGFCIGEICEIMQLPKGTVKSRLFYARKKLQEKLAHKIKCEIG